MSNLLKRFQVPISHWKLNGGAVERFNSSFLFDICMIETKITYYTDIKNIEKLQKARLFLIILMNNRRVLRMNTFTTINV